jgi:hydroxymethylbilane synthase
MMKTTLRIGTRASSLARIQTDIFVQKLKTVYPSLSSDQIIIIPQETSGDKHTSERLSDIGGKGLFTKELDAALLKSEIDIAVYSLKDVETILPDGIDIACVLERGDPRDVFISKTGELLESLPKGSIIGTASLRRQSQILNYRPDLKIDLIRGNVPTRLKKLETGPFHGTLLALAGLKRLGLEKHITEILDPSVFVPAPGQGAIVACIRKDRHDMKKLLDPLNHEETLLCTKAERALAKALDATCRTPVGSYAIKTKNGLLLKGFLGTEDGTKVARHEMIGENPTAIGEAVADRLKQSIGL